MFKKFKQVGRKVFSFTLALSPMILGGSALFTQGDSVYDTISIKDIKPVEYAEQKLQIPNALPNYNKMSFQETIDYVKTPAFAQDYLDSHISYDHHEARNGGFWIPGWINTSHKRGDSFKITHEKEKGICIDYAISAAALLSDDGFPPLIITMNGGDFYHAAFLYRTNEGFGAVGNGAPDRMFNSVDELVKKGFKKEFNKYKIVNLDESYNQGEWIKGKMDLLKNMPQLNLF